jgi:hypothetical protein
MAVVRHAVVFVAALAAGMIVAMPVAVLGLVVPGYAIVPVTFGVATAFSVLCAVWVGNLLVWGASRGGCCGPCSSARQRPWC